MPEVDYAAQKFSGVRFVNDLERPVFEKFVFLGYIKTWLRLQPEVGAALLSGSGSTVFAVLRDGPMRMARTRPRKSIRDLDACRSA